MELQLIAIEQGWKRGLLGASDFLKECPVTLGLSDGRFQKYMRYISRVHLEKSPRQRLELGVGGVGGSLKKKKLREAI